MHFLMIAVLCFSLCAQAGKNDWHLTIKFDDGKKFEMPEKVFKSFYKISGFFEKKSKESCFFDKNQVIGLSVTSKQWNCFYELVSLKINADQSIHRSWWENRFKSNISVASIKELADMAKVSALLKASIIHRDAFDRIEAELYRRVNVDSQYLKPDFANMKINKLNINKFDKKMLKNQ